MLTFLILITGFTVSAQLKENYQPVKSSGQLPEDFVKLSGTKVEEALEELDQGDFDRNERKTRAEFQLTSNFFVDRILLSGQALFGDEMTSYISGIADRVLADDADLRNELRFYVVRSSQVNAFSTDPGVIVVTTGLLARCENEAQIAFVLAHEIEHYIEEHVVNSYLEAKKIEEEDKSFDVDKALEKLSNYSKDQELEADTDGLNILANTEYDKRESLRQLDHLLYSYLPFSNEPFDPEFLETEYFKIPKPFILDSVQGLPSAEVLENLPDSESSHPNIAKRKSALEEVLGKMDNPEGKLFIDSEERFELVKDLARFESIRIEMNRRQYADAIYQAFVLSKKYPDNQFLKKAVAKSLYAASVYKTFNHEDKILWESYDIDGASQQVHFLLEEMSGPALSTLAMSHVRDYLEQNPDDAFMKSLEEDLLENIVVNHEITRDSLLVWVEPELPEPMSDEVVEVPSDEKKEVTELPEKEVEATGKDDDEDLPAYAAKEKVEESKEKKPAYASDETESMYSESRKEGFEEILEKYYLYIFTDVLDSKGFNERMESLENELKTKGQEEKFEYGLTYQEQLKANKKRRKEYAKKKRRGKALGIDEVILLDPYTVQFDNEGKAELRKSEENQVKLNELMIENAKMNDVKIKGINAKDFEASDIEKFNQGTALHLWINERVLHGGLDIVPLESDFMYKITDELGVDYLNYSLVLVRDARKQKRKQVIVTALLVTTLPYALFYSVQPGYESLYANLVYDLKTGELMLGDFTSNKGGFRKDYINRWAYDQFWQLSRDPSKLE